MEFYLICIWLKSQAGISDYPKFLLLVIIISALFFLIPFGYFDSHFLMNAGSFFAYKYSLGMKLKRASLLPYIIDAERDDSFLIKKFLLYLISVQ